MRCAYGLIVDCVAGIDDSGAGACRIQGADSAPQPFSISHTADSLDVAAGIIGSLAINPIRIFHRTIVGMQFFGCHAFEIGP